MSKNLFYKVLVGLLFIGVAVVWLLSVLNVISIELPWVISIFAFALGGIFILKGMFQKNIGVVKKFNILFGALLVVAGIIALIGVAFEGNLAFPIIAIVATAAILLSVLVVGGKKWDQGDNQNAGYKNYYERKKEEEDKNK